MGVAEGVPPSFFVVRLRRPCRAVPSRLLVAHERSEKRGRPALLVIERENCSFLHDTSSPRLLLLLPAGAPSGLRFFVLEGVGEGKQEKGEHPKRSADEKAKKQASCSRWHAELIDHPEPTPGEGHLEPCRYKDRVAPGI